MAIDPYAAPKSRLDDVAMAPTEGAFIPSGRRVPAGNGWQWIVAGWQLFARRPGTWLVIALVWMIASACAFVMALWGGLVVSMLMNVLVLLLTPVVIGALMIGCRELDRGGELVFDPMLVGAREHFGALALIGVLCLAATFVIGLISGVVTGIGVGAVSLVATGSVTAAGAMAALLGVLVFLALLVPVAMAVWFAPLLIVFNGTTPFDALKASFAACLKNVVSFLVYGIVWVGLAILATLPVWLGWLVLGPTLIASVYASYRDIFYAA